MQPRISWATFSRRVLSLYAPGLRRPATRQRMRQVLRDLEQLAGADRPSKITAVHVARWMQARNSQVRPATVKGELGYLRAALNLAADEGWIRRSPFDGRGSRRFRVRSGPPLRQTHHSAAEIGRLLAHLADGSADWIGRRLFTLVSLVAFTGVRRDEALRLQLGDVRLDRGVIDLVDRGALKTERSAQPVPIAPELAAVLAAWMPLAGPLWLFPGVRRRGPWIHGGQGGKPLDRLKAAGRAVGVDGLTWQSLRHSWATHAETRWGLTDPEIQRVLRHTSPATSRRYRHADVANLVAIAQRISFREA